METIFDFDGYRRFSERKNYLNQISFSIDSIALPAAIENISLGGALIRTRNIPKIKTGTKILVSIPFANKNGCIKRKAKVKWVENDLFGIEFI
jgi:hypothetical protein